MSKTLIECFAILAWGFILCGTPFCVACNRDHTTLQAGQTDVVSEIKNNKHNFVVRLHHRRISISEDDTPLNMVEYISIAPSGSLNEIRYLPPDPSAEQNPNFYFQAIQSPDEETLVLPLGMFAGFGFVRAKSALVDIKERRFFETVAIHTSNGTRLAHTFEGWDGNQAIRFKSGLSGDMVRIRFNFMNRSCESLPSIPPPTAVLATSRGTFPLNP